ncbi:hypothetical protein CRG98_024670 [Punica granatum]|nr:hypothetical protein CRG98_024670 [Punica granatum]
MTSGHLKHTQPTRSAVAKMNAKVQGPSSSTKTVASSAISGPGRKSSASKSTLPQAKRNVGKVAVKFSSSTHVKTTSVGSEAQGNPPFRHVPNGQSVESSKMGVPLSENCRKLDGYMPNMPIQTAKPSGLRMPSPSMGFFGQPKASASRNLVNKYIQPSNIPRPTSASLKNAHDIWPPQGNNQVQQLVNDHLSGNPRKGFHAANSLGTSHEKQELNVGSYSMKSKDPKPQNGLTDEISSNQQDMHDIHRDVGEKVAKLVESCEPQKQLPLDNKLSDVSFEARDKDVDRRADDGEVKLSEKKSPLSTEPSGQLSIEEDNKLSNISSEEKDEDVGRRVDFQKYCHDGIVLQTEDVSMANMEEHSISSNETHGRFFSRYQSAKAIFSDDQNTTTGVNQNESFDQLQTCGGAENADSAANCKEDTACEAEISCGTSVGKSKENADNDSAGSQDGSRISHADDAENPLQDENLTISCPSEGNKFVTSSKDVAGNVTKEPETLGCQNVHHSLSASMQPLIGSQDSYTDDVHVRNDIQLCEGANDLDEELLLRVSEGQSIGATMATDSDSSHACLLDTFSKTKMAAEYSISLLPSSVKNEDGLQIGDLTEHEHVEGNQNIYQDISSPTSGTNELCFDETLIGYSKEERDSDKRNMTIVRPETVDSGLMETDNFRTPLEGQYAGLVERGVNGANVMSLQMEVEQPNPSDNSSLSDSAAKNESVAASDLVEQSGEHPHPQHCLVEDDLPLDKGVSADHNSSHKPYEKSLDNGSCESKDTKCISFVGAEPDHYSALDVVDEKAENDNLEDLLSDFVVHENNPSHLSTTPEVDASLGVIEEGILWSQAIANGKETCPLTRPDDLKSSKSHVEVDLLLDHSNPNSRLQHHSESTIHSTEHSDGTLPQERCENNQKQNGLLIKPPPNVPPFSDEWLAALEAAGEEILTMKSGAVQNSPPDKTVPELGPWSPVKKKHNQGIGPFDCTKFTNTTANIPDPGSQ